MKQSSIEWLVDEINVHLNFDQRLYLKELFEQAKAMHKQEIMDAHAHGRNVERGIDDGIFTSEEYYNKNFNTK